VHQSDSSSSSLPELLRHSYNDQEVLCASQISKTARHLNPGSSSVSSVENTSSPQTHSRFSLEGHDSLLCVQKSNSTRSLHGVRTLNRVFMRIWVPGSVPAVLVPSKHYQCLWSKCQPFSGYEWMSVHVFTWMLPVLARVAVTHKRV